MKLYILIFVSLIFTSCEFEDQWKKGVFNGKVLDSNKTIDMDVTIDLKQMLFKINETKKSFPLKIKIETEKSLYFTVENSENFPLASYFQIKKENLTQYRLNMFNGTSNTNMIFADLFIDL